MAKILFFNPPARKNIYLSTNASVGAPSYPSLTLATLAANLINKHEIKILDLEMEGNIHKALLQATDAFKPDIIASSANTPNYFMIKELITVIKKKSPNITTIVGGVHITALPEESSKEGCFDILVLGEGDEAIPEILSNSAKDVPGVIYKNNISGKAVFTQKRKLIDDLNALPYPAWHLFKLKNYKNSRLSSRRNPVGLIETSRGCAFQCNFCNKLTFGSGHRVKEPKRVVDEMEYMLKCGFREIHVADDSFTQNINRAKEICAEILGRGLKFPWSLFNGIRVDMVDPEFFKMAKKAGCWQIGFGVETGDQGVLDKINKKITLPQIERAVRLAKKSGISTFGFFILALAGETEKSMRHTIDFAKKLPLDIAKFDICIPYPGTPYYNELKAKGRMLSENWLKYNCHQIEEPLFDHMHLEWPIIRSYYKKAFREFYLRPSYILRRFAKSLRKGDLLYDINYFFKAEW